MVVTRRARAQFNPPLYPLPGHPWANTFQASPFCSVLTLPAGVQKEAICLSEGLGELSGSVLCPDSALRIHLAPRCVPGRKAPLAQRQMWRFLCERTLGRGRPETSGDSNPSVYLFQNWQEPDLPQPLPVSVEGTIVCAASMVAGRALSTEYINGNQSHSQNPMGLFLWLECTHFLGRSRPGSSFGLATGDCVSWDDGCFWKLPRALPQGPMHPLPYSHPTFQSLFSQMEALSAVVKRADGVQGTFSILGIEFGPWIY